MPIPVQFQGRLAIPAVAAPMFLVSNPDLELLGHALAPYRGTIVASEVSDEVAAALSAAP